MEKHLPTDLQLELSQLLHYQKMKDVHKELLDVTEQIRDHYAVWVGETHLSYYKVNAIKPVFLPYTKIMYGWAIENSQDNQRGIRVLTFNRIRCPSIQLAKYFAKAHQKALLVANQTSSFC
jgi:hypothetical protein